MTLLKGRTDVVVHAEAAFEVVAAFATAGAILAKEFVALDTVEQAPGAMTTHHPGSSIHSMVC
jgi:hypothetical protein